ncbi:ABC-type Fe3+-hydroxamate transport system, periplasmic component [Caldisphaera lagunensis DSM 15908]|uniref:ABC-type Fe3+-hydroxamate transport system, periplasmic component n=1 Tax=Caldisphaera lagunensis (strain DSM 15908 / JCM 11604 / ANMR 0165 / IC-154) TaxID=1056495 RepID=L0ABE6_CALLD|nr:ABC transporter substrate-binding protein [Caldisphaera lagunensis]AFZ70744.1 ABC-type Fe3+-hydroxamate transport system, periplasmic component [Caldisphaera lagunensis DSM 15908]
MKSGNLIIALLIILIIGIGALGYSMMSLYNEMQKEINNLNSTILNLNNKTQITYNEKLSELANKIGSLENSINNFNSSVNTQILSLQQQINSLETQSQFPVTLIDATNTSVTITSYPERIVSLDPATTEILLSINATNQLVGVDNDSFYYLPPQYENELWKLYNEGKIINIGSTYSEPNIELILSAKPDLVIGTYQWSFSAVAQELKNYGIPTVLLPSYNSLSDLYNAIIMAGRSTGNIKNAVNLVESMSANISYFRYLINNISPQNVSYLLWINPTYVAGGNTFQNDMFILSGNNNVFSNISGWPIISPEELLQANPSIIIIDSNGGLINETTLISWLQSSIGNAYQNISAIKYNRVYTINGYYSDYLDEPGPMVIYGIKLLMMITHPSLFNLTTVPNNISPNTFPLNK